jgi:ubiquinone/menaquinone biosynthesis C-methylase UbiE
MAITIGDPSARSGPASSWDRVFAHLYDPFLALGEWSGIQDLRRQVLSRARGRTLEIGSGTGLNLPHYPDGLQNLVLVEPSSPMLAQLERRRQKAGRAALLIQAPAEDLPLPDGSVDTVVSTFVLCTVHDPKAALGEVRRVMAPDGQLLFIEHVRASSARLAKAQDLLERPWQAFAAGCHCNLRTLTILDSAGFETRAWSGSWRGMPPIVRPLVAGSAIRA